MKVLVLVVNRQMDNAPNIKILDDFLKVIPGIKVDYAGIARIDSFDAYNGIISFKYKIISYKQQINKVCDFITDYRRELDYDWYIKIRPDIKLLEPIRFDLLVDTAVNARAREYIGPRFVKDGNSVGGEGKWKHIDGSSYADSEQKLVLDDMIYIFSHKMVEKGAFNKVTRKEVKEIFSPYSFKEFEWVQTGLWDSRGIPKYVIGIPCYNTTHAMYSGDINKSRHTSHSLPLKDLNRDGDHEGQAFQQ